MSEKIDKEKNNKKIQNHTERFIGSGNDNYYEKDGRDLIEHRDPFNLHCSICDGKIKNQKYICVICPDCILCPKCEETHIHPVLKCKSSQLSTLKDIYIYINKRNMVIQSFLKNEKDSSGFKLFQDIFSEKYEIKLSSEYKTIYMRPNKSINIPITLQNISSNKVDCKLLHLFLISKNIKDLKVYDKELDLVINKREQNDVNILVESNNHISEYNFIVELYSLKNIKLKSNTLEFNIIVNDDEEEEELNEEFKEYPNIIISSKETKQGIKTIMENKLIKENPITIFQFLKNNNNDIDKTIDNLTHINRSKRSRTVI